MKKGMLSVLANPAFRTRASNPLQWLLYSELQSKGVRILEMSVRHILFSNWNVLHLHWPEAGFVNPRRLRGTKEIFIVTIAILIARIRRRPIVWTVHNLLPHDRPIRISYRIWLRWFIPHVDAFIVMNNRSRRGLERMFPRLLAPATCFEYIPHPIFEHLRDQINRQKEVNRDKVLVPGAIRRYKNLDLVMEIAAARPDLQFDIAGPAHDDDLVRKLKSTATLLDNLHVDARALSESELAGKLAKCGVVLLPYHKIHNSGTAMLAATAGCPIMIAASPAADEVAQYLPPTLMARIYRGQALKDISDQLDTLRNAVRPDSDELKCRQADYTVAHVADAHFALYKRLIDTTGLEQGST